MSDREPLQYRVLNLLKDRHRQATWKELEEHHLYELAMRDLNDMTNFELLEVLAELSEKERAK